MSDTSKVEACSCNMRKKVALGILGVLPEEICGVSDSDLADFMSFDKSGPNGEPVLALRFCPWCSHPIAKEERITHVQFQEADDDQDESESWRGTGDDDNEDDGE